MSHVFQGIYTSVPVTPKGKVGVKAVKRTRSAPQSPVSGGNETPRVQSPVVRSPERVEKSGCGCSGLLFKQEVANLRRAHAEQEKEIGFLKGKVQSLEDQVFFLMESLAKKDERDQCKWAEERRELLASVEILRTGNEQLMALTQRQQEHHVVDHPSVPIAPIDAPSIRNTERAWGVGGGGGARPHSHHYHKIYHMQCLVVTEGSRGRSIDVPLPSPPPWEMPATLPHLVDSNIIPGTSPSHLQSVMFCIERNGVRTVIDNPRSPNTIIMQDDRLCVVVLLPQASALPPSPRISASRLWRDRRPSYAS